jgi:predicted RecA/RadA family phage recombinase
MAYSTGPKHTSGVEQTKPITWKLPCGATVVAGDVFEVGTGHIIAFAQTDYDGGYCSATIPSFFVEKLPVTAVDDAGNSAVAVGDTLALDGTVVNKDTTNGENFGMALEAIDAGETANIWVAWIGTPEL